MNYKLIAKLFYSSTPGDLYILTSLPKNVDEAFELIWITTCLIFTCSLRRDLSYQEMINLLKERFEDIDKADQKLGVIFLYRGNREFEYHEKVGIDIILKELK